MRFLTCIVHETTYPVPSHVPLIFTPPQTIDSVFVFRIRNDGRVKHSKQFVATAVQPLSGHKRDYRVGGGGCFIFFAFAIKKIMGTASQRESENGQRSVTG
jgi:hypothetical protein